MPEMATMSAGHERTGPSRSESMPGYGGCARPTPGREATSSNLSTAEVCATTAEVPTAEVCATTAEVPTATAVTAALVLRGGIGSKR
jgi:hypothetical protein